MLLRTHSSKKSNPKGLKKKNKKQRKKLEWWLEKNPIPNFSPLLMFNLPVGGIAPGKSDQKYCQFCKLLTVLWIRVIITTSPRMIRLPFRPLNNRVIHYLRKRRVARGHRPRALHRGPQSFGVGLRARGCFGSSTCFTSGARRELVCRESSPCQDSVASAQVAVTGTSVPVPLGTVSTRCLYF